MFSNYRFASKIGVVLLVILGGVFWFVNHKSLGFSADKVSLSLPFNPEWEVPPPSAELKDRLFCQHYRYLASGSQSYAFISEDSKYVIKFFRMKHLDPEKKKRGQENLLLTFKAHKMAFDELKEESGLVYLHLNKTKDLRAVLTVFDKMGRAHKIDLDQTEFVVQEKAELIFSHMKRLHDPKQVDQATAAVLDLIRRRIKKGFADADKAVSHNYGFVGDRPIHLDIGRLYRGERPGEYEKIEQRIKKWQEENSSSSSGF